MKVVAILQARIGSTRLKNKMLLDLAGAPLVQRVIERVKRAKRIDQVVLAFPSRDIDAFIPCSTLASLYGYALDENDLVGRYLSAAIAYDADIIVRIPCDNPCIEPEYIDEAVREYMASPHIFQTNTLARVSRPNCGPVFVDGIGAEVFSVSRLKWLDERTREHAEWREHPHKYFYDTVRFACRQPSDPLRLDVNTQQDYEFIKDIYDAIYPTNQHFTIDDILAYLDSKKVTA